MSRIPRQGRGGHYPDGAVRAEPWYHDGNFWAVAVTAGVFTYLFDFFDIHYSAAVAAEIDTNPASGYVFPQAQAFRLCRDRMELSEPGWQLAMTALDHMDRGGAP